MAMQTVPARVLEGSIHGQTGQFLNVVRQPILDLQNRVHGYELLFWNGRERATRVESGLATRTMADNTVVFGVEQLACGLPVFMNCTADSLTDEWVQVLPPQLTVLELPADSEPTPALLAACRKLKAKGIRLALHDYSGKPESEPLVSLADYIKVSILKQNAAERIELLSKLSASAAHLVAEHVETPEEFNQVRDEGFTLFQGYYFCHPEPVKNHKIPGNRMVHLEILETLQDEPADLERLGQLVRCDASLTYRLLRFLNSPVCAMRQEVTSVQTALLLLGETTFRRIAMLAIASDFNSEQPAEILRMAFERGRFCELTAALCGLNPSEQYLIGMVSLFPAMLRIPMEDLVNLLPLRMEAGNALLAMGNPEGVLLKWLVAREAGDWAACETILAGIGVSHDQAALCYINAVTWADDAVKSSF